MLFGKEHSICYKTKITAKGVEITVFIFSGAGFLVGYLTTTGAGTTLYTTDVLNVKIKDAGQEAEKGVFIAAMADVSLVYAFLNHAEVQTKVVAGQSRVKEVSGKVINDTNINLTTLDCTWFTNIVREEGFKVRGHFRLQPVGEGRMERKLIYIKDFEKSGYTRKAKIENESNIILPGIQHPPSGIVLP